MRRALVPLLLSALLLPGCGGMNLNVGNLWPFGQGGPREVATTPSDAVEYRCEGGRKFYVRSLGDGAVWLIAPDREIRLQRLGGPDSNRFGVARVELVLSGDTATLYDPPATYSGCKRVQAS